MGTPTLHIDIAIIGGGIAGLWALHRLRNRGYSVALFESEALGGYQTIASQGIIHGGIKYALSGVLDRGSEAIAAMPDAWRSCLDGTGDIDLRRCEVLSENFYLWSNSAVSSRLSAFFASKLLRGRVEKLSSAEFPEPLQHAAFNGQVYRLQDLVLDVPSLLRALAEPQQRALFRIDWRHAQLRRDGRSALLSLPQCDLRPQKMLLCAGAGNEALIAALQGSAPAMQRRPLQQVLVKHQYQGKLFGHCMGSNPSPRLTVTSHRTAAGEPLWYLGGDLATAGQDCSARQLIDTARRELQQLLPGVELGEAQWRAVKLDRAEPRQATLLRPDSAFLGQLDSVDNALVAWPTKLTLCPQLGDEIVRRLQQEGVRPRHSADLAMLQPLSRPPVAQACWETLFA